MGKYIFQASHFSSFLYKAIVQGTSLTPMCLSFTGGVHNGEYVPWLYCYDPVMDVWARKQDMNTKRAIHTLAVMNDRLYAIGGNHLKGVFLFVCLFVGVLFDSVPIPVTFASHTLCFRISC